MKFFTTRERMSSGLRGTTVCGRAQNFTRRYEGTMNELLDHSKPCAAGDVKFNVNFAIRSEPDGGMTAGLTE